MQPPNIRKKLVAVVAALAIVGVVGASAASLGGLDSDSLGADTGDVAACDTDGINVAYTHGFDVASGEYLVDSVTLSDIAADCIFRSYEFSIFEKGDGGARHSEGGPVLLFDSIAFTGNGFEFVGSRTWSVSFSAEKLEGIALQIGNRAVAL